MLQTVPQANRRPFLIHARVNTCPVQEAGKLLGKKWHLVIVHRLLDRPMGFNELKEAVGPISAKILTQALHDLQAHGVVDRRLASQSPVRVQYSLTTKGADLQRMLAELESWGRRWGICGPPRSAEGTPESAPYAPQAH